MMVTIVKVRVMPRKMAWLRISGSTKFGLGHESIMSCGACGFTMALVPVLIPALISNCLISLKSKRSSELT
jgi:hypothetical protein